MWQSGGVLFLALKMSQDPVDDVLVLNACDDPDRTTAASANANWLVSDTFTGIMAKYPPWQPDEPEVMFAKSSGR